MLGLMVLTLLGSIAGWFAWLYWVTPSDDIERIKADQAGTDLRVIDVEREGTKHIRPELSWVGGRPAPRTGGQWFRIYAVTAAAPGGLVTTYAVGVEARLFGYREIKRIDWRA